MGWRRQKRLAPTWAREGCWLEQVDAARVGEPGPAGLPAPGPPCSGPCRPQPLAVRVRRPWRRWRVRARVCERARSHCSISASRCAPPSPRLRSLAGSGPQPTLGGPGDGFLLPPSHPPSVPTLLALPHLLSFKDHGASPAHVFHNAWAAQDRPRGAVWPACPPGLDQPHFSSPCPGLKGQERGGVRRGKESGCDSSNPGDTWSQNSLFLQKSPIRGRDPNQKSQLAVWGKWEGGAVSAARPPTVPLYCFPCSKAAGAFCQNIQIGEDI
ncbi:hypothetical protein P7K49_035783 [Saguinus oedipus]|uniref:Uncharacterized protein n=1 Tax=Saguinus oedipus TaxID=9490 RepID=A0ABQ9TNN9_SAGOE|nr:hypothetical protein P7K49_035783 [Saguinus oedipus]